MQTGRSRSSIPFGPGHPERAGPAPDAGPWSGPRAGGRTSAPPGSTPGSWTVIRSGKKFSAAIMHLPPERHVELRPAARIASTAARQASGSASSRARIRSCHSCRKAASARCSPEMRLQFVPTLSPPFGVGLFQNILELEFLEHFQDRSRAQTSGSRGPGHAKLAHNAKNSTGHGQIQNQGRSTQQHQHFRQRSHQGAIPGMGVATSPARRSGPPPSIRRAPEAAPAPEGAGPLPGSARRKTIPRTPRENPASSRPAARPRLLPAARLLQFPAIPQHGPALGPRNLANNRRTERNSMPAARAMGRVTIRSQPRPTFLDHVNDQFHQLPGRKLGPGDPLADLGNPAIRGLQTPRSVSRRSTASRASAWPWSVPAPRPPADWTSTPPRRPGP
jgi:hypothetical protein